MAAKRVIGVDVGGTKILAGLVDREGNVVARHERPTPTTSEDALLTALDEAISEVHEDDVAAVGLGIPSRIDQRDGCAVASVNVPLEGVPLRDRMAERFSLPVGIDNDANAAAIAEWVFGAGKGARDIVMLTLGTGVGGGLIVDGRPFRGATGSGAELGHIVIEHDGPPCQGTCTGRGHLEALASGGAADRAARALYGDGASGRELVTRAREGDERAVEALRTIGRYLGSGIATFVNTFEPELVVLGGGFASACSDLLIEPAREVLARDGLAPGRDTVRIEPASLGADAGLVGAGLVAFEAVGELSA
jgi:glucokinase